MRALLTEAYRRLQKKSEQAVFKLTQAMGGGKTHNLITLGMLAKHPEYRGQVLKELPGANALRDIILFEKVFRLDLDKCSDTGMPFQLKPEALRPIGVTRTVGGALVGWL